jgi:mono/diheme cytochrome c family protein
MRRNKLLNAAIGIFCVTLLTQCFTDKQNQGQRLYEANCQSCHMEDGSGLRGLIPPLAKADFLQKHRDELPCIIRNGIKGNITVNGVTYNQPMPGVEKMREDEITNLLNYIQTNFGNNNERYTFPEVEEMLENCN